MMTSLLASLLLMAWLAAADSLASDWLASASAGDHADAGGKLVQLVGAGNDFGFQLLLNGVSRVA